MNKRNWLQILASYTGTCRGKIALSVLFAVAGIIGGFIPYYAVYQLIRFFIHTQPSADGRSFILFWCGAAAAGYVGKTVFNSVSTTFSHIAAFTILEQLRLAIAARLEKAPLGTVAGRRTGSYKDIILDRVEEIEKPLAHLIPEFSSNLLLPVLVFIWMMTIHPVLGLSLLIAPALSLLPMHKLMKDYNAQYAAYMEANHQVNNVIVEYVEGIEVIKAFNQSTQSYEKYASMVTYFKDFTLSWFRSTWKDMNLALAIMPTTLLGVLPAGLILFRLGAATPDQLAIAFILSLSIITPLQKLSTFVDGSKPMEYAVLAADELLTMEEMPEGDQPVPEGDGTIELRDVSFSYHSGETPDVLRHVSLTVPQGSFTALVGPSGGGKSTIARLIARLWDPQEGQVLYGGMDIRRIRYRELASRISYVTQDNFLFRGTLLDNIRLGRPDASQEEVLSAARAARCDTFIDRLQRAMTRLPEKPVNAFPAGRSSASPLPGRS